MSMSLASIDKSSVTHISLPLKMTRNATKYVTVAAVTS
uniref:Uncharacterized protein n=1 Tax=Anguilla anguilla TaxID=7936 RepID=A0A0E9UQD9_ANGAN